MLIYAPSNNESNESTREASLYNRILIIVKESKYQTVAQILKQSVRSAL